MTPDEQRARARQLVDSMPESGLSEMLDSLEEIAGFYTDPDVLLPPEPPRTRPVTGTVVETVGLPVLVIEEE